MAFLPRKHLLSWAFLLAAGSLGAQAAPPDAGEVLRGAGMKAPTPPGAPSKDVVPNFSQKPAAEIKGGPTAEVRDIILSGNSVFSTEQLKELVADQLGKTLDLAGMKALARRISDYYRERGYPFARAIVPVQEFQDGRLLVTVLEGRYGEVKASGSTELVKGATPFLSCLRPGDLLEAGRLERTMLLIDDIPGVGVTPSVSPGAQVGTSDLEAAVRMDNYYGGDVGLDNAGSRYTGYYRGHASWYANSLAWFGDKLSTMVMATDLSMILGSADYERPFGGGGLRWQVGYAHTTYELGEEYAELGASGLAKVWSTKLSYPLVRSQRANLSLTAGLQFKELQDDFLVAGVRETKSTVSFPCAVRFDCRDNLFAGAVSYGMLSCTLGRLSLDDALAASDAATARKAGGYEKFNLDLARIQSFGRELSLYARVSAQWATNNLDSSERLGIGGTEGVRSYPLGEGTGDTGWLGQVELRYSTGDLAPYLLYDVGSNQINYRPWDAGSDVRRNLSGAGIGLRYDHDRWSGNLTLAYRIDGGLPTQDVGPANYRLWFSVNRSF